MAGAEPGATRHRTGRCARGQYELRLHAGPLPPQRPPDPRAAFLSARNDALAIIAAGLVPAVLWQTAWPNLIVGLGIAAMNADAAREVWTAAQKGASRRGMSLDVVVGGS
jgi:hypothetical protein